MNRPLHSLPVSRVVVLSLLFAGTFSLPARAAEAGPVVEPSVGVESAAGSACALSGRSGEEPLPVFVSLDPSEAGDIASLEPVLACAADRHLEVIVRLKPPSAWQRAPDPYAALDPWLHSLDLFMQAHVDRISAFELGTRPETLFDPKAYAFMVEKVGTLLRSLDPRSRLFFGAMGEGAEAWLQAIPPSRLAPYVYGVALQDPIDLERSLATLSRDYPAVTVWLHARADQDEGTFLRRIAEARASGVRMIVAPGEAPASLGTVGENLSRSLPARFIVDSDPLRIEIEGEISRRLAGSFMDPLGPERAILVEPPLGERPPGPLRLTIFTAAVKHARAFDLAEGRELVVPGLRPDERGGTTSVTVVRSGGPVLIRFLAEMKARGAAETVGVTAEYEPSAEEIVARMRAFEAGQNRVLRNYTAKATLSYHYRAEELDQAVDYSSVNRFYWQEGVGEYEELEVFINGARWRGPPPSLPFVQAEKVKEVPIDIRLDESYVYRLEGRESLEGIPCYVVSFEPVATDRSLYSGRVWVAERTFERGRIKLVQHGLREPITSKSDEIDYGDVAGEGRTYRLPVRGYRQMVFTVLGRSVVVERRVTFDEIRTNPDGFDRGRAEAFASERPILRDDEKGIAHLVRQADGTRTAETESLENTALFGGIGFETTPRIGLPFVGLNYFNFDWRGTGTQLDVAFAGVLLDVAWTDPRLGSSRWEISLEGRLLGLPGREKRFTDSGNQKREEIKVIEELGFFTLARPLTSFSRAEFRTGLSWDGYTQATRTDPNMILPADGFTLSQTARWRYHRYGYLLSLWASTSQRFGWKDWGLRGGDTGSAEDSDYQKWGLDVIKSYYPGHLQKIGLNVSANAGRGLDRFSRFQIGDFGSFRIRGYNGSGITFDRGVSARVTYQFTLPRGGVSLEIGGEAALIENQEDFGLPEPPQFRGIRLHGPAAEDSFREHVAGGGLGVSWSGPWGTLMSVRSAWALSSSLPVHSSTNAWRLVVIKTFGRWPFKHHSIGETPSTPAP